MGAETETKASIRPLADRVLVKLIPDEGVTKGGVVLPQTSQERSRRGEVLAVGPGLPSLGKAGVLERVPPQVEAGETVLFSHFGGVDVKIDDVDYIMLREGDLLGVIES